MKTLQDVKELLHEWGTSNKVGSLLLFKYPGTKEINVLEERVVKLREMDEETANAFVILMDNLGIERGEVVRNKEGLPDRVKLTRRIG